MSFRKFTDNDVFRNTMRAYPKVNFFVFDGRTYYNSTPNQKGTRNATVKNAPVGSISLYEFNIDRPYMPLGSTGEPDGTTVPLVSGTVRDYGRIAPWISKDSARSSFKTVGANAVGKTAYNSEFQYGDILQGQYPLTASITREFITGSRSSLMADGYPVNKEQKHYVALRNRLDFYAVRSLHYKVSSPYGNKDEQNLNILSIPSIFYGTKIKPGSLSLKWNYSGSLIAELKDLRENGELIQVSGTISSNDGKVAGVVMYDEGIILLTGSWQLSTATLYLRDGSTAVNPSWLYYGVGAGDGLNKGNLGANYVSASYNLDFKGHTETQVVTMFAHAMRGQVNYSNNPTFLEHGQTHTEFTSSHVYEERADIRIKNIVSSSYSDYNAPFKRNVYVSRIAIYDKSKNLMGVATISNPILKEEGQDYSFKLKLDI
tara:strand:+ start:6239 stop:7528 length:1290 start_codon:yes stop_codon:yes gene_type:complete